MTAHNFVLTFVPLFIVIDAIGNLPFVIAASEGMTGRERFRMINIAITTAAIVGLAELVRLDQRAHGAVDDDNAFFQQLV